MLSGASRDLRIGSFAFTGMHQDLAFQEAASENIHLRAGSFQKSATYHLG